MDLKSVDIAVQEELERRLKKAQEDHHREILLQREKEEAAARVVSSFVAFIASTENLDISSLAIEASESIERRVYDIVIRFDKGCIRCLFDCDAGKLKLTDMGKFYRSIRHGLNAASLYADYDSIVNAAIYAQGLN